MPMQPASPGAVAPRRVLWRVVQWLIELCHEEAYGTVTLKLSGGRIVMAELQRAYKPEELPVLDAAAGGKHLAGLPY